MLGESQIFIFSDLVLRFILLGCIMDNTTDWLPEPRSPTLKVVCARPTHQSFFKISCPQSPRHSGVCEMTFLACCASRRTSFILTSGDNLNNVNTPSDTLSTAESCLSPSVLVIRMLPGVSRAGICAEKSREGTPESQSKGTCFRGKRTAGVILSDVSKTEDK